MLVNDIFKWSIDVSICTEIRKILRHGIFEQALYCSCSGVGNFSNPFSTEGDAYALSTPQSKVNQKAANTAREYIIES